MERRDRQKLNHCNGFCRRGSRKTTGIENGSECYCQSKGRCILSGGNTGKI
ncbi:MAG: hypothetical protein F9K23_18645 [Bacteroidetes bacterium]|nr:MAG: hypothetical protein F9K23_18645 [Bacteroidota bacterium]